MKVEKKVIAQLNKCYSIGRLRYQGKPCFLVAPAIFFRSKGSCWTRCGRGQAGP